MALDPGRLPVSARSLIPLAEQWGIGDDFDREHAVSSATPEELRVLASSLDGVGDEFWEWLEDPDSFHPSSPDEYVAMTALTMAVDSARVKLKRQQSES